MEFVSLPLAIAEFPNFSNNLDELLDFIPQLDKPHGLFFCDTATSLNCDKHVTRSHDNLVTPIAVWPSVFDTTVDIILLSRNDCAQKTFLVYDAPRKSW